MVYYNIYINSILLFGSMYPIVSNTIGKKNEKKIGLLRENLESWYAYKSLFHIENVFSYVIVNTHWWQQYTKHLEKTIFANIKFCSNQAGFL